MKNIFKLMFAMVVFLMSWSYIAMAQVAAPVASPAVAVISNPSSGIMGWVNAHGGLQASALLLMFSALTGLSAVRTILYKYDGLDLSQPVPADYKTLTLVNKICLLLGNVVDFLTGNVQHS